MTLLRAACSVSLALALALTACMMPKPHEPKSGEHRTRGVFGPDVRDSAYLLVDRTTRLPTDYGLYTVLLTRTANRNAVRVLSELFSTTGSASEAVIPHANLNLITIPVKNATVAEDALASARSEPDATATAIMQRFYDFNQAALLMSSVCRPDRGAQVMKACGSTAPDGPLLVTTLFALDGITPPGKRLLVVNLSTTPSGAIGEVLAVYREQILSKDFADRAKFDGWRLWALNHVLEAAGLLPKITKALADS